MARHLSVELLADHPQHVETLARWHCEDDGRGGDTARLEFWRRQLRAECGRNRIPIAFVALDGETPVGLWNEIYEGESVAVLSMAI